MIDTLGKTLARGVGTSRATFMLALCSLGLTLLPGSLDLMALDRTASHVAQVWRQFSGHLVHSDSGHLAWNLLGLVILGMAFEPLLRWRFSAVLAAAALVINAWFYLGNETLTRYCGLSGVLNGVLVMGLLEWHRRSGDILPLLVLLGATAKLCFELFSGLSVFTETAWQAVPQAHLMGMLAGFAWYLGELCNRGQANPL